jgi:hypothetical protein
MRTDRLFVPSIAGFWSHWTRGRFLSVGGLVLAAFAVMVIAVCAWHDVVAYLRETSFRIARGLAHLVELGLRPRRTPKPAGYFREVTSEQLAAAAAEPKQLPPAPTMTLSEARAALQAERAAAASAVFNPAPGTVNETMMSEALAGISALHSLIETCGTPEEVLEVVLQTLPEHERDAVRQISMQAIARDRAIVEQRKLEAEPSDAPYGVGPDGGPLSSSEWRRKAAEEREAVNVAGEGLRCTSCGAMHNTASDFDDHTCKLKLRTVIGTEVKS